MSILTHENMSVFNNFTNGDVKCADAALYAYTRLDFPLQEYAAFHSGNIVNIMTMQFAIVPPKRKANGHFPAFHFSQLSHPDAAAEANPSDNDNIARQLEDLRRAGPLIFGPHAASWFCLFLDPVIDSLLSTETISARHNDPPFNARKIMRLLIEGAKSLCLADTTVPNYMERAALVLAVEFIPASWSIENFRAVANSFTKSHPQHKRASSGSLTSFSSPAVGSGSKKSPRTRAGGGSASSSFSTGGSSKRPPRSSSSSGKPASSGHPQSN